MNNQNRTKEHLTTNSTIKNNISHLSSKDQASSIIPNERHVDKKQNKSFSKTLLDKCYQIIDNYNKDIDKSTSEENKISLNHSPIRQQLKADNKHTKSNSALISPASVGFGSQTPRY